MDRFPEFEISPESSRDDEKEKKEKAKRQLGALSQFSFEKESNASEEKRKKDSQKRAEKKDESDTEKDKKAKRISEENKKKSEKKESQAPKQDTEENSNEAEIEAVKIDVLKEQLPLNIAKLKAEAAFFAPNSVEHISAVAALEVEHQLLEKAENPELEVSPDIEAEFDRRIAELELDDKELPVDDDNVITTSSLKNDAAREDLEEGVPPSTSTPTSSTTPTHPLGSPSLQTVAAVPASSQTMPGGQPAAPPTPSSPTPRSAAGFTGGGFNVSPPTTGPITERSTWSTSLHNEQPPESRKERSNKAGVFLLAGYMLGRRGDRKRTEAQLQPKIDTLQKQMDSTKQQLERGESALKKSVAANYMRQANRRTEVQPARPERSSEQSRSTPVTEILRQTIIRPEGPSSVLKERSSIKNDILPDITRVLEKTPVMASILGAETQPTASPEAAIRRIEQLSTPDILRHAENIYLSGVSVKELYTTNQIDRRGLIALVQESMRGGNIKDTFEKVELGRERQRERAREFRHDDPSFTPAPVHASPTTAPPLQSAAALPASSPASPINLPGTPDTTGVQPIKPLTDSLANHEDTIKIKRSATTTGVVIMAFALALVIVWVLFSL